MKTTKPSSITETSNSLTNNIDIVSPEGIVRLLRQSDAQLFSGYEHYESLYDERVLESIYQLSMRFLTCMNEYLKDLETKKNIHSPRVVFSGCGTSGRVSFFCAQNYNECMEYHFGKGKKIHCFSQTISGSESALVKPIESAEDNSTQGIQDLKQVFGDYNHTKTFVGITCGLSAPYVAGQLDELLQQKKQHPEDKTTISLVGFNPLECARVVPMENWHRNPSVTFKSVSDELFAQSQVDGSNIIIVNPVVGPEPITGSTRMKGGSATKIILDACFSLAVMSKITTCTDRKQLIEWLFHMIQSFELSYRNTYDRTELIGAKNGGISTIVQRAAKSLQSNGRLLYIGCNNSGAVGFIDASECLPTYGTPLSQVRGYVDGGWDALYKEENSKRGQEMREKGNEFKFTFEDFENDVIKTLTGSDVVVFTVIEGDLELEELNKMFKLYGLVRERMCSCSWIYISASSYSLYDVNPMLPDNFREDITKVLKDEDLLLVVNLSFSSVVPVLNGYAEYSLKLILNVISTGAHVLKGMTFGNRMINLRVSNDKLYRRSIDIIRDISNVDYDAAEQCLLRSIYQDQDIPTGAGIGQHISRGAGIDKVVPVALLLASKACETVDDAVQILYQQPVVRSVIMNKNK
ncbi:glucokinase regulatory protein [Acrasis kona]|uniref:Glucokinase regulatory protein n=1 Tax=Acrasis kona TaxID=1008807 RepID=A0AAW2ZLU3_9EUKA